MANNLRQYYFSNDSTERVVQVIRQHIIILISNLSFGVALLVAGLVGLDALRHVHLPSYIPNGVIFGVEALYFAVTALLLFMGWFIYSRTEVIITDKHLVDVTQKTFFSRDVSQLEIARVQDVTDKREGILQTVLNYGTVIIQTAGEKDFFELKNLPHPDKIAREFIELFPKWGQELRSLDNRQGLDSRQPGVAKEASPSQETTAQTDSASPKTGESEPEAEDYLAD
jgi:membrane protein YdbS with pleckstrin-like domain